MGICNVITRGEVRKGIFIKFVNKLVRRECLSGRSLVLGRTDSDYHFIFCFATVTELLAHPLTFINAQFHRLHFMGYINIHGINLIELL